MPRSQNDVEVRASGIEGLGVCATRAFAAGELLRPIAVPREVTAEDVVLKTEYAYPAYGVPSEETNEAIRLSARLEGMMTDAVYEGKSMQGMIDLVKQGFFPGASKVLYAHLGGVLIFVGAAEPFGFDRQPPPALEMKLVTTEAAADLVFGVDQDVDLVAVLGELPDPAASCGLACRVFDGGIGPV